jgi:hypothetical protein
MFSVNGRTVEKNEYVEINLFIVNVGYRLTSYYSYGLGIAMQH